MMGLFGKKYSSDIKGFDVEGLRDSYSMIEAIWSVLYLDAKSNNPKIMDGNIPIITKMVKELKVLVGSAKKKVERRKVSIPKAISDPDKYAKISKDYLAIYTKNANGFKDTPFKKNIPKLDKINKDSYDLLMDLRKALKGSLKEIK